MPEHLIFHLTASMAAMGDLAGHERRGSLNWPGRSAIIGLLAAALGRRREDDVSDLNGLGMAVASIDTGRPLRDYHTVETVPSAAVKKPLSRPHALHAARGKTNTTITKRDYRMGVAYGIALWNGDLPALAAALRRPVFPLYFGRKSCSLSAPINPQIVESENPVEALRDLRLPLWVHAPRIDRIAADTDSDLAGLPCYRETRQDVATDRQLWHFAAREVTIAPADIVLRNAWEKERV